MTDQLAEESTGTAPAPDPGPPAPIRIAWAPVPKVNLLPIEILEARRFQRTQLVLVAAVLAVLLLAGTGTYLARRDVADANDQLAVSQARVSKLQAEQAKYAAVPLVITQVEAATTARTLAMGSDVLWYRYLNDVDGARPVGVELSALGLTLTATSAAATSADPLASVGVGTVTMDGTADQYSQVADWLDAVTEITGFSSTTLTSAAKDATSGIVTFTLTAVVDSDALSARYTKDAG